MNLIKYICLSSILFFLCQIGLANEIENPTKNISISFFSMRVFFHQNDAAYHIPLIISPYGMSCWISR